MCTRQCRHSLPTSPVASLLKTVEQRYNRTDSLQVLFRQSYTKAGRTHAVETGLLYLRKPGRMRWDYSDPKGKLVVCDGKMMSMYTPSENRVDKQALKETDDLQAPIAFLLGKLHFDKEFKNLQGKPEGPDMRITAEPKTDNLPYTAVEFLVAPEGRIREVKVTGFDNSITAYTFEQEKIEPQASTTSCSSSRFPREPKWWRPRGTSMAEFVLKYADGRGQIHQQVAAATSEKELRDRYSSQGFLIYSIKPRTAPPAACCAAARRSMSRSS